MDEITKRKISYKLKGRKKAVRTKWLISNSMKGKQKTQKHKEAISQAMAEFWEKKKNRLDKDEYKN